jgi:hypothetical protein
MPRGIDADHSPHGGDVAIARNWLKSAPQWRQLSIQHVEYDPRLDHNMLRADRDDLAEMAAHVDNQPRTQRPTAGVSPGPTQMNRNMILGRIANDVHHVIFISWNDHSQRIDLVKTCIVRVGSSLQGLEIKVAPDYSPQIVIYPSAAFVHGGGSTSSVHRPQDSETTSDPGRGKGDLSVLVSVAGGLSFSPRPLTFGSFRLCSAFSQLLGADSLLPVPFANRQVEWTILAFAIGLWPPQLAQTSIADNNVAHQVIH